MGLLLWAAIIWRINMLKKYKKLLPMQKILFIQMLAFFISGILMIILILMIPFK